MLLLQGDKMKEYAIIKEKIISFKTVDNNPILVLGTVITEKEIKEKIGSLNQIKEIFAGDL